MLTSLHGIALRYFVEVARSGSLSAASETLHVDVSAISRQIGKLERDLKVSLFERLPRGMELSESGRKLMTYAARSMLDAEHVTKDLREIDDLRSGTIRIASSQGFAYGVLPSAIATFCEIYPGVKFEVFVGSPGIVSQRIREGESDVGVTFTLSPTSGVRTEHEEIAPIYVLVSSTSPLAKQKALTLKELDGMRVVLPEKGTTLRELVEIGVGLAGITVTPVIESNNSYMLYRVAQKTGALMFTALVSVSDRYKSI
jgi:Transcriptional regulator